MRWLRFVLAQERLCGHVRLETTYGGIMRQSDRSNKRVTKQVYTIRITSVVAFAELWFSTF